MKCVHVKNEKKKIKNSIKAKTREREHAKGEERKF